MKAKGNFKIQKTDKKYSIDKANETKRSNKYEKQLISMKSNPRKCKAPEFALIAIYQCIFLREIMKSY